MKKINPVKLIEVLIAGYEDVALARQKSQQLAVENGFSLLDQMRIVTATSELARNIVIHAKQGQMSAYIIEKEGCDDKGFLLVFEDRGAGIRNVEEILRERDNSRNALCLGLPGVKRLSDEFHIHSVIGKGTKVEFTKWLQQSTPVIQPISAEL